MSYFKLMKRSNSLKLDTEIERTLCVEKYLIKLNTSMLSNHNVVYIISHDLKHMFRVDISYGMQDMWYIHDTWSFRKVGDNNTIYYIYGMTTDNSNDLQICNVLYTNINIPISTTYIQGTPELCMNIKKSRLKNVKIGDFITVNTWIHILHITDIIQYETNMILYTSDNQIIYNTGEKPIDIITLSIAPGG